MCLTQSHAVHFWSLRVRQVPVDLIDDLLFHLEHEDAKMCANKS